jgi:hypothetical protein
VQTSDTAMASNRNFRPFDNEARILQCIRAIPEASIRLANAISTLTNMPEIQDIVKNRFRGKIRFFNNRVGIKAEIFFDGDQWSFRSVGYEDGQEVGQDERRISTTKGFSLDELACFLSAFDQAYLHRDAHYSTFRARRPLPPTQE